MTKLSRALEDWLVGKAGKPASLRLVINSTGGDLIDAYALVDEIYRIRRQGVTVTTVVYGQATSAAGLILQAGNKRVTGPNGIILIHEASQDAAGKTGRMADTLTELKRIQEQYLGLMAKRSNLTLLQIHEHVDGGRDWWIPAQLALELGFVDEIEASP